jgi:hypothetical protein
VSSRSSPIDNRLAIEDLLADTVLDEPGQLLRRRRALPGAREPDHQVFDLALRHHDLTDAIGRLVPGQPVDSEQSNSEQQEVQERLAKECFHFGVYQIGDV